MKRLIGVVCLLIFAFVPVRSVLSHGASPSVIEVNGEAAEANEIADEVTPTQLIIAKEINKNPLVIGELVRFSLETDFIPGYSNTDILRWSFGDLDLVAPGLSAVHRYAKSGTYVVTLTRQPRGSPAPETVTTLLLSVLPRAGYEIPEAKMTVNGKPIDSTLLDAVETKPGKQVLLDASGSTGAIQSYQWDFGDGSGTTGKTATHTYKRDTFFPVYALLRVTDANGITSDAMVTIDTPIVSPNSLMAFFDAIRELFANLFAKKY